MTTQRSPAKTRSASSTAHADTPFVNNSAQTLKKNSKRALDSVRNNLDLTLSMEEEIHRLRNEMGWLAAQFGEFDHMRNEPRVQENVMAELQALRAVCEQQQRDIAMLRADVPGRLNPVQGN